MYEIIILLFLDFRREQDVAQKLREGNPQWHCIIFHKKKKSFIYLPVLGPDIFLSTSRTYTWTEWVQINVRS